MIQLVVNTIILRELDERKLINAYARHFCDKEEDLTDDIIIQENLTQLLDWDINGDNGLKFYCGKFESIKRKDWEFLVNFIKKNSYEIEKISRQYVRKRKLNSTKVVLDAIESKEEYKKKRFSSENYQVSGRGKKAKPCIYEGREYKSRQECMYKEGILYWQLYKYLKETNQL